MAYPQGKKVLLRYSRKIECCQVTNLSYQRAGNINKSEIKSLARDFQRSTPWFVVFEVRKEWWHKMPR